MRFVQPLPAAGGGAKKSWLVAVTDGLVDQARDGFRAADRLLRRLWRSLFGQPGNAVSEGPAPGSG
jgi:hypothetical protein